MRDVASTAGVSLKTVSRVVNGEAGVRPARRRGSRRRIAQPRLRAQRPRALAAPRARQCARARHRGRRQPVLLGDRAHGRGRRPRAQPHPHHRLVRGGPRARARAGPALLRRSRRRAAHRPRRRRPPLPAARDRRRDADRLPRPPAAAASRPTRCCSTTSAAPAPAVEHLLAHGPRADRLRRRRGRRSAPPPSAWPATAPRCATPGLRVDDALVRAGTHDAAAAERPCAALLALPADRRPTALFTANNRNTVGALRALRDGDGTVALVGFDDFELADMLPVPVTVVRPRPGRDGPHRRRAGLRAPRRRRTAAAAAHHRLRGRAPADPGSCPRHDRRRPSSSRPTRSATSTAAARRSPSCAASTSAATTRPRSGSARRRRSSARRERGLSRLPDGRLVRDALAADPEAWLGAEHVARFGADPALLVKLLDAGERLPVHHHPDRAFAREHLGWHFGKTEAWLVVAARAGRRGARRLARRRGPRTRCARWVARPGPRRDARRAATRSGERGRRGLRPRRRRLTPSATGILIVELQEPTDLSILLEWDGFGDRRRARRDARARLGRRAGQRRARRARPEALRGPARRRRRRRAAARRRRALLHAPSASRPAAAPRSSPAGFAVVVVVDGAGTLAGLDVDPRRRAARTPCRRARRAPTATSWPSPVAPRRVPTP